MSDPSGNQLVLFFLESLLFPSGSDIKCMSYVAVKIKHYKNLLLLQALLIYFFWLLRISVWHGGMIPGKTNFFSVRDILTSKGILVRVRENLTPSKKSEGGEI